MWHARPAQNTPIRSINRSGRIKAISTNSAPFDRFHDFEQSSELFASVIIWVHLTMLDLVVRKKGSLDSKRAMLLAVNVQILAAPRRVIEPPRYSLQLVESDRL